MVLRSITSRWRRPNFWGAQLPSKSFFWQEVWIEALCSAKSLQEIVWLSHFLSVPKLGHGIGTKDSKTCGCLTTGMIIPLVCHHDSYDSWYLYKWIPQIHSHDWLPKVIFSILILQGLQGPSIDIQMDVADPTWNPPGFHHPWRIRGTVDHFTSCLVITSRTVLPIPTAPGFMDFMGLQAPGLTNLVSFFFFFKFRSQIHKLLM